MSGRPYAYGIGCTRMSGEDEVLHVKWSLLIRVWGVMIRVSYAYGMGNTRMAGCLTSLNCAL